MKSFREFHSDKDHINESVVSDAIAYKDKWQKDNAAKKKAQANARRADDSNPHRQMNQLRKDWRRAYITHKKAVRDWRKGTTTTNNVRATARAVHGAKQAFDSKMKMHMKSFGTTSKGLDKRASLKADHDYSAPKPDLLDAATAIAGVRAPMGLGLGAAAIPIAIGAAAAYPVGRRVVNHVQHGWQRDTSHKRWLRNPSTPKK